MGADSHFSERRGGRSLQTVDQEITVLGLSNRLELRLHIDRTASPTNPSSPLTPALPVPTVPPANTRSTRNAAMDVAFNEVGSKPPAVAWGSLPQRVRVLYFAPAAGAGGWLCEALAADRASEVILDEAAGDAAGVARLREERYDAVLVCHEPGALDALEFVEALRAGGAEEPIVVLGAAHEHDLSALCYEAGADAYLCVEATTTRALLWTLARSIEWRRLVRENRRLVQAERNRLRLEHSEAERLLDEQRALIRDLERLHGVPLATEATEAEPAGQAAPPAYPPTVLSPNAGPPSVSPALAANYRELLRAYVIMGSGNLAREMAEFADSLAA